MLETTTPGSTQSNENLDCSSKSCCLEKCSETTTPAQSNDCSSQSCLNDPSCLEKCLEVLGLFGFETTTTAQSNACLDKCLEGLAKTSGSSEGFSWDQKMEIEDVVEAISNMTTDEICGRQPLINNIKDAHVQKRSVDHKRVKRIIKGTESEF